MNPIDDRSDEIQANRLIAELMDKLQRRTDALRKVNEWYEGKHEYAVDFLEDHSPNSDRGT